MTADFDYNIVPRNYLHCFNGKCCHAAKCLRYQVTRFVPIERIDINIVNPARTTPDAKTCPFFVPDEKHRFAYGITHLLDNIPYKDAVTVKQQMIGYFGKHTYYRYFRKERYLKPSDQEFVHQLFRNLGIKEEPVYDGYEEYYEW